MSKFYITTAIDYTNDVIHIGHSYQKLLADALARYHRLIGDQTFFLTGTDEHGQKVEKSAKEKGIEPKKFVNEIAQADKKEWLSLNVSFDRFIRTTDEDHIKFCQEFYLKSKANGDIYLSKYSGLYCEGCEAFVDEEECQFHPNKKPQKIEEENYFFRLSKYQDFLEKYIEEHAEFVVPESKRQEILTFIRHGLKDFSVSRKNVNWGIPVPDDTSHTIYVWFDALINYLTYGVEENCWPADVHVLGKDNQRFHAIYWSAMLKSAGYELPKTILVHDFISLNGQKVSKSLGNVILPSELVSKYGVDGVRYFFLRYGPLNNDVDISLEKVTDVYNADLANGLGNLVARVAKLCETNGVRCSALPAGRQVFSIQYEKNKLLDEFKFNEALFEIWQTISELDQKIEKDQPWKNKNDKNLISYVEKIRTIATTLLPFLPQTAQKILDQFKGPEIKSGEVLFPRIK